MDNLTQKLAPSGNHTSRQFFSQFFIGKFLFLKKILLNIG